METFQRTSRSRYKDCAGQTFNSPSLERIYPSEGYVSSNVTIISYKANRLKQDNTPEQLIELGEKFQRLHASLR